MCHRIRSTTYQLCHQMRFITTFVTNCVTKLFTKFGDSLISSPNLVTNKSQKKVTAEKNPNLLSHYLEIRLGDKWNTNTCSEYELYQKSTLVWYCALTIKISPVALADLRPNCLRPHKASMREDVVRAPVAVHAYQNVFLMHIIMYFSCILQCISHAYYNVFFMHIIMYFCTHVRLYMNTVVNCDK